MAIRVGVYDFFSYVVPGSVIVFAVLYLLAKLNALPIDPQNISTPEFFILIGTAYLLGFVVDVVSKPWRKIFSPKDTQGKVIREFSSRYPAFTAILHETDWYVFLSFIKRYSLDIARDVEQNNATSIMLRNSSFSVLFLGFTFLIDLIFFRSTLSIILSMFCVVFSVILQKQSIKFKNWFYLGLYQSTIALILEKDDFFTNFDRAKIEP
ncbi:MAG: hypothetical protein AAGG51_30105 [Cyanobacteria bacterium P01_G01_bin.54]